MRLVIELALSSLPLSLPLTVVVVTASGVTAARRDRRLVAASTGVLVIGLIVLGLLGREPWDGNIASWQYGLAGFLAGLPFVIVNVVAGLLGTAYPIGAERAAIGTFFACILAMPATGVSALGAACSLGDCL